MSDRVPENSVSCDSMFIPRIMTSFSCDITEVMFVTMNFAQAYYSAKLESDKKISEINLSDEVTVVMGAADEACNP